MTNYNQLLTSLQQALDNAKAIESASNSTDTDVGHVNGLLEAIQLVNEWATRREEYYDKNI